MELRHKKERNELTKANNDEMAAFNNLMDQKMHEINQLSQKQQHDLTAKHKKDLEITRK